MSNPEALAPPRRVTRRLLSPVSVLFILLATNTAVVAAQSTAWVSDDHGAGVEVTSKPWAQSVMDATITATTTHEVKAAGPHVLKIYMVDAGVVLDKIVVDAGGVRPSYLGPPETRVAGSRRTPARPARR